MVERMHHIALIVSEREQSLRFYEALGFSLTESVLRPERGDEILFMSGHGVVLEVFVDATRPPRPTYPEALGLRHIAFTVGDVSSACEALTALGYRPESIRVDTRTGAAMTFVKDPDGLPIELREY